MKKFLIIFCFLFVSTYLQAQIRSSISNLLRYGNGEQTLGLSTNKFKYFENLTDARFSLPQNVTFGLRFLYDEPPEVGQRFKGISRRFIEYRKDNLFLRVGNSSELYGRGLVLNLFENRGLAYDTWLDGIKGSYKLGNLKASIIGGTVEFTDSINVLRTEKYELRGGNVEYDFLKSLKIGLTFISSESKIPQFNESIANTKAELPELYVDFSKGPFNAFINWAHKWTNSTDLNKKSSGYGIYSAFSYAEGSFGITIDYKNYSFDIQDPFLRNDETRTTKFMPFQNPPIVMKEHSYTLLTRSLHEVNFNDEVGFQIDANYSFNENLYIELNFSLSSRHNSYEYNNTNFSFSKIKRDGNFLPSNDDEFSPYIEFFTEAEYYFNSKLISF